MAEHSLSDLDRYDPPHGVVARSQLYLLSAKKSADEALSAMQMLREERRKKGGLKRGGRTSDQDQDLLRAMLVFSCAGVDAAIKALIEDALPTLAEFNSDVHSKLDQFAEGFLADAGSVSPKALARVLGHEESPRRALVTQFIEDLTGGSLQSANQLQTVCGALGLNDPDLRKEVQSLHDVFQARNQIIHELDLSAEGWFNRRQRAMKSMVDMADSAFTVTQMILNSVCQALWDEEGVEYEE